MIPGILSWLRNLLQNTRGTLPSPSWVDLFAVSICWCTGSNYLFGATIITALAVVGILRLQSVSFMVDDIPEESQIRKTQSF